MNVNHTSVARETGTRPRITQVLKRYSLFFVILGLSTVLALISPSFLTATNLMNILWNVAVVGIMAVGSTFVILTGGIDLSVGSIVCISGVVIALLFDPIGMPLPAELVIVLLLSGLLGLINGLLVTKARIAPFIVTLATMAFYRGVTMFLTNGQTIGVLRPESFMKIGLGKVLGVPIPVIIFAVTALIGWFVAQRTTYGRSVYLLGGNKLAAQMSGIRVSAVETFTYVISGFTAGVAGIVLTSLVQQAGSNQGSGYELDVIASIVLGGASLFGGVGTVGGAVIGAILMGIISNGLNLLNVASPYHPVVKGIVIILAVALQKTGERSR